jgi:hypothetical protein
MHSERSAVGNPEPRLGELVNKYRPPSRSGISAPTATLFRTTPPTRASEAQARHGPTIQLVIVTPIRSKADRIWRCYAES